MFKKVIKNHPKILVTPDTAILAKVQKCPKTCLSCLKLICSMKEQYLECFGGIRSTNRISEKIPQNSGESGYSDFGQSTKVSKNMSFPPKTNLFH